MDQFLIRASKRNNKQKNNEKTSKAHLRFIVFHLECHGYMKYPMLEQSVVEGEKSTLYTIQQYEVLGRTPLGYMSLRIKKSMSETSSILKSASMIDPNTMKR